MGSSFFNDHCRKTARCNWMLIVTELITSGTQCISRMWFEFQNFFCLICASNDVNVAAEVNLLLFSLDEVCQKHGYKVVKEGNFVALQRIGSRYQE